MVWSENYVTLNSLGLRDREFDIEKDPGTFRIYALGDSYTFGWLINDSQKSFPKIIEKNLQAVMPDPVEVINGPSPGFTIKEMVKRFKEEGKFLYPDLATVGINDEANVFEKLKTLSN